MMNIEVILLTFLSIARICAGLRCVTCDNAGSHEECFDIGEVVDCKDNQESCHAQVRINHGQTLITKRCKQTLACENNEFQNNRPAWDPTQCNPGMENSVCHCCCADDLCNNFENCTNNAPPPVIGVRSLVCDRPTTPLNGQMICGPVDDELLVGSICEFSCDAKFKLVGTTETECAETESGVVFELPSPSCEPIQCPMTLPTINNGRWNPCSNENFVDSECTVTCDEGTSPTVPSIRTICQNDETWSVDSGLESHCADIACPTVVLSEGLDMECTGRKYGDSCAFTCDDEYILFGQTEIACGSGEGINGQWSHPTPKCKYVVCDILPTINDGIVDCVGDNKISDKCTFTCLGGYEIQGADETSTCTDMGADTKPLYIPPSATCTKVKCPDIEDLLMPNSEIDNCTDIYVFGSECTVKCMPGYFLVGLSTTTCQADGQWAPRTGSCEPVLCSEVGDLEFGSVSCTSGDGRPTVGTSCTFSCDENYFLSGNSPINCVQVEDSESGKWDSDKPTCRPILCPEFDDTEYSCTNGLFIGSVCKHVPCPSGFFLDGDIERICSIGNELSVGVWSSENIATCSKIFCNALPETFQQGTIQCNGNGVGDSCAFTCNEGYKLAGTADATEDITICAEVAEDLYKKSVGQWSKEIPKCIPMQCKNRGKLEYGEIECSADDDVNSVCEFKCVEKDYKLFPPTATSSTCQVNRQWDVPKPCCERDCPPYAKMDLEIVLDSSSSIGMTNWNKTVGFVINVIKLFEVGPGAAKIGVFRYNRRIDTKSEIVLGAYTDRDDLIRQIKAIPYDGSGTKTNAALLHANKEFQSERNRKGVKDILFLVTDGLPSDEPAVGAEILRNHSVLIKILPIVTKRISENEERVTKLNRVLNSIVADPENDIIRPQQRGFDALTQTFAAEIGKAVCGKPCEQTDS